LLGNPLICPADVGQQTPLIFMRTPLQIGAALCLCFCALVGCRLMNEQPDFENHSLLKPAQSSPDSVRMEIIWARFPVNDPGLNEDAWRDIEEAQLDPATQRELANNGLRAGVIKGKLPDAISRALKHGESTSEDAPTIDGETRELLANPVVRGRVRQMPRDQRYEISASDVYPVMQLLVKGTNEVAGGSYEQAQAMYAMRVDPQPDQTALVELTPEVHYGSPRMKFTGGDETVLHQAMQRDREVFDRLRMSVRLAPGDMLVIMSLPDSGSRLGQYFHIVESSEGPQQKLILIRLAEVPQSDAFASIND
jgi:hypothetical protein